MKISTYTSAESLCKWIFEFADFGIIITDNQLNIVDVNRWIMNQTGKSEKSLRGKMIMNAFPEIRERKLERYLTDALEGASVIITSRFHQYLLRLPAPPDSDSDEMKQTARVSPLFSGEFISGLIIHIEDVTDRVKREEQMQRKNEELIELNAMKDKFFRIVSHDLRSPFVSLLGLSEILKSDMSLTPEKRDEIINMIHSSVKEQYNFLENLLRWSQLQTGHFELSFNDLNLNEIITHIINLARPAARDKKITLLSKDIASDYIIHSDKQALTSILYNLVFNALKFTNEHGRIEISAIRENGETNISVSDNGVGIPEDKLEKLFKPGELVSTPGTKREKGSGLGLILVRELVDKIGGRITVWSLPGEGSTFTISVPSKPPVEKL